MTNIDTPVTTEEGLCRSCGASLQGEYCVHCGEKAFAPGEHSFRHFLGDVLNAITFLDGKFVRSIKLMFTKPGEMSYQFVNGRRVPFIKPMSMFFIANLIYFMFPVYNTFNTNLTAQMYNQVYSGMATRMVKEEIKEQNTDIKTFTVQYDTQSTNMAKMCLVLVVFYLSIPLWLVNYNRKLFYFDHLLVALEICSLIILSIYVFLHWVFVWMVRLAAVMGSDFEFLMSDRWGSIISAIILLFFFFKFERNAYRQPVFQSVAKSAALVFFFYLSLQFYRVSLFFITMWTI